MAIIDLKTLAFIRSIPKIGARVYEAFNALQQGINTIAVQGNLDPNQDPAPPPNIQKVTATGQNGFLHVSIQDQSAGLSRGTEYVIEHADNRSFINAQQRFIGASRGYSEFIGNDTRFVRAYSTTSASANSEHVYHGSSASPTPVSGGGSIGPPAYLPSQGAGTGAPGQAGYGQGPVQTRTQKNSFDWTRQSAQGGGKGGFQGAGTPAGLGALTSGSGGGGGGGGSPTISEVLIAPCETLTSIAGTGNAITGVTAVPYSARAIGFQLRYFPIHANSGATTISENSIAAVAITQNGTNALAGGELVVDKGVLLEFDGMQYQIIGSIAPISATVLASDANGVPSVAPLATAKIWIGSAGSLPVAEPITGDVTLSAAGAVAVIKVNGGAVPASAALTGTNGSSQIITAAPLVIQAAVGFVYIATENGANNAISSAAGSGPTLVDGLEVTIQLAHTLGTGTGNTFAYSGGAAVPIRSHRDTSVGLTVGYAATGRPKLSYQSGPPFWMDMSQ